MINFKRCGTSDDYELHLGTLPTDIFWPTQAYKEADFEKVYGLDMEMEAMCEITDALCDLFPDLKFDYGRTRLEISIALHAIRHPTLVS